MSSIQSLRSKASATNDRPRLGSTACQRARSRLCGGLVKGKSVCGGGGSDGGDVAEGPFGDRVIGGEALDRSVGAEVDEQRVDLDEFAGLSGSASLGPLAKRCA